MNNKHYIGQKAKSTTIGAKLPPISKVILNGDNDAVFEAGDDSGQVLETFVPSATQRMALDILNRVKGFAYQGYKTTNAFIAPDAELGDGVTVGGVYGILAHREFSFTPKLSENVSSPYQQESDHEYNYEGTYAKQIDNKVQVGALYYGTRITRKNGIEVVKTDGDITKSRVTLNSDTLAFYNDNGREAFYFDGPSGVFRLTQYADVDDAIIGSEAYSSLELTAQQLNLAIQDANRSITALEITAQQLSLSIQDANSNITSLEITTNGLTTSVSGLSSDISNLGDDISDLDGSLSNLGYSVSTLEQKVNSFTLRVQNSTNSSMIYLDAGNINLSSQKITFSGVVTFTDLSTLGNTTINGSNITTGTIKAQYLDLTGAITFSDLSTSTQNTINNISTTANNAVSTANSASSNASTALTNAANAATAAANAATAANDAATTANAAKFSADAASTAASAAALSASTSKNIIDSWTYTGTTYIDGSKIMTGTVVASTLAGGTVGVLTSAGKVAGTIAATGASSANFALDITSNGALRLEADSGDIYIHRGPTLGTGKYIQIKNTGVFIGNSDLRPTGDGTYDFGYPNNKWNDLYAKNTTIQTSDRNEKYNINYDINKYDNLFDSLKPCSYKFRLNESGRTHLGMIAQDIEESLDTYNIDSQDFAPFIKFMRTDEDGNILNEYGYGLRYSEFIPMLIHQTQKLKQRVAELEARL